MQLTKSSEDKGHKHYPKVKLHIVISSYGTGRQYTIEQPPDGYCTVNCDYSLKDLPLMSKPKLQMMIPMKEQVFLG